MATKTAQPKFRTMANIEAGECRWPIGDPRHADFHFCAAPQAAGRPYCSAHWDMSFDASKSRSGGARPSVAPFPSLRRAA